MKISPNIETAREIMLDFALITGLHPPLKHPKRYLWTDAFAVCNYLELYKQLNDRSFLDLALELVNQVHHILGRYDENDTRKGWISRINEDDGKLHPTIGGLRIGKELNERQQNESFDERLEWDRDGQYYHYLTKWMHTLSRLTTITNDPVYVRWGLELAQAAHHGFTYTTAGGARRMYWKMSVDLSRPQVPSMGQQDPLDGYITYNELQEASKNFNIPDFPLISSEIDDMAQICRGKSWVTEDPLGIGGLLSDSLKVAQLLIKPDISNTETNVSFEKLLINMLESALIGLDYYIRNNPNNYPPEYRLAFREMGLSIGIKGFEYLNNILESNKNRFKHLNILKHKIKVLKEYMPLAISLESFWLKDKNRKANTWTEHLEINMVMLATSLAPCGFLRI